MATHISRIFFRTISTGVDLSIIRMTWQCSVFRVRKGAIKTKYEHYRFEDCIFLLFYTVLAWHLFCTLSIWTCSLMTIINEYVLFLVVSDCVYWLRVSFTFLSKYKFIGLLARLFVILFLVVVVVLWFLPFLCPKLIKFGVRTANE